MSPISPVNPPVSRWRLLLAAILTLLLWPALMVFPGAPEGYLDASWQEVLLHARIHGWQFGRELVFTWGPWGFLGNHFHLGEAEAVSRLVWETLGKLLVAAGLVALTQRIAAVRQVLFVVGLALFNWLFIDTVYQVLISLAVVRWLLPADSRGWRQYLALVALAFLAGFKFTYLLLATGGVGLAAGAWVWRRDFRTAALLVGGYALAFVLVWLAASQHPDHIVPFLRRSLELSSGYGDAMGVDEPWPVFLVGAGLMLLAAGFVFRLWQTHPDRPYAATAALFLAATWFIVWKSTFTRADGHVFGLFIFTLLLAVVLPGLCHPERRWHWFDLTPLGCLLGIVVAEPGLLGRCPEIATARIRQHLWQLPRLGGLPAAWENSLAAARAAARLPAIQAAVGRGTVDVFNYEQAVAVLNGLNFTPRPVFQSYAAFTPRLAWRNLRFYQSDQAPEFVLWKHMTIDGRYPTQDDAALVSELPRGYAPLLEEGDYLLLQKVRPLPARRLERRLLFEKGLGFDEELVLPAAGVHPRWLQVSLPLSKLGRLRSFLYKPPVAHLTVTDSSGRETTWRLLPQVAADGFLLDPLLETQADFAAFARSQGGINLRSLRLTTAAEQREFWSTIWRQPVVRLFELPEITLEPQSPYQALVNAGLFAPAPEVIKSDLPLNLFSTSAGRMMLLHAPGEIAFSVPPESGVFTGNFGVNDGAYVDQARTDGVEFVIEAEGTDGVRRTLWRRWLDPLNRTADRGPHSFRLEFPPGSATRLTLRTLPGPAANSNWDWAFVGNLRLGNPAAP